MNLSTLASASFLSREDRRAYLIAAQRDEQIANLEAELRLDLTPARRRDVRAMLDNAKALRRQGR
ncbi:MAG TPA: hypothetical protein VJM31_02280 [Vicinamibacterales bacterium]|nr:hypothetical protein [Vicinamibacterales bacterium]